VPKFSLWTSAQMPDLGVAKLESLGQGSKCPSTQSAAKRWKVPR
jgi:hypothetical protein